MSSILDGIDEIIERSLGFGMVGVPPRHRHKSNYLALETSALDGKRMLEEIGNQICRNIEAGMRDCGGSAENWRWEKKLELSENNPSREKRLEKAIARHTGDDWVNQVPTSSGVVGSGGRHRNLDLVHRLAPGEYEFIELKVDSDTPLYAAMECLCYGTVYLCSRVNRAALGYSPANLLLNASRVELKVLAPERFYNPSRCRSQLCALQGKLDAGLRELIETMPSVAGLEMGFSFEAFPDECEGTSAEQVRDLLQRRHGIC